MKNPEIPRIAIPYMDRLDNKSKPYTEGGYEKIFEAAASDRIVAEDVVLYSQSLQRVHAYPPCLESFLPPPPPSVKK